MFAANAQANDVKVKDAWTRATAPGQDSAMVQAVITSKEAARVVGVKCKDATTSELHSMVMEGGMMKMRQVDAIDLPAGQAVDLGQAGYHLMLLGLKKPLAEGKKTECELTVRSADGKDKKVKVKAKVKALTEGGAKADDDGHDAHHDHHH
ncbi:MAG: hypothetical protein Fur0040_10280 [Sideroxydans sp.]